MQWFRLYNDILEDPKVQKLSPELFKFWINILCVASKNEGKLPPIKDIAFALRMSESETEAAFHSIKKAHLIDEKSNQYGITLAPHNWNKRQYKSDTSTERVKRFRNGKRNSRVTPPDTDSETDTEQNILPLTPKGEFNFIYWNGIRIKNGGSIAINKEELEYLKKYKEEGSVALIEWKNNLKQG
jgi:hypothetical protein